MPWDSFGSKNVTKKTDQLLAGAHFELRDEDGSVLEELVTDKNGEAVSSVL